MTVILSFGSLRAVHLRTEIEMSKAEALQAAIANRPERPHRHDSTETIKAALVRNNEDAKRYARTGLNVDGDMLNAITNEFLDELRIRGEL
jgi:hypothetical protein